MTITPHSLIIANADIIAKAKAVERHAHALETVTRNWQLILKSAEREDVYSDGTKCRITRDIRRRNFEAIAEQEAKLVEAIKALSNA
jgi:predicted transposase YbfD/YdcC